MPSSNKYQYKEAFYSQCAHSAPRPHLSCSPQTLGHNVTLARRISHHNPKPLQGNDPDVNSLRRTLVSEPSG